MRANHRRNSRNFLLYLIKTAVVLLTATVLLLLFQMSELKQSNEDLSTEMTEILEENQQMQGEIKDLTTQTGGIEEKGSLFVEGAQLLDEKGNPVMLRGISSHGIAWYPEYANYRSLKTLKDYGANVFRIAMYVEQSDGYLEEPELNRKLLYSAIENSLAADLYTIVDWHVLRDENPNRHAEEAISVFEEIAKRYGDEPGIIYEICNEPNGDTTYDDIINYAEKVIPVIRKYAPNALILVGTPRFCTSLSEAVENPIQYPNIMYTYHFYAGVSDCKYAIEEISNGLENGLSVFISEWGLDDYRETKEGQGWKDTVQFLDFLEEKNISWINWSLCNKDEGYSMISPNVDKLYGWKADELTDSGLLFLQYLTETKTP